MKHEAALLRQQKFRLPRTELPSFDQGRIELVGAALLEQSGTDLDTLRWFLSFTVAPYLPASDPTLLFRWRA